MYGYRSCFVTRLWRVIQPAAATWPACCARETEPQARLVHAQVLAANQEQQSTSINDPRLRRHVDHDLITLALLTIPNGLLNCLQYADRTAVRVHSAFLRGLTPQSTHRRMTVHTLEEPFVSRSILLIDDEPTLCSLLKEALMRQGYQVNEARDGNRGLEQFQRIQPDLVLVDVNMPGRDGFSVVKELRSHNLVVGILMMSALKQKQLTVNAIASGADGYLTKPFRLHDLLHEIQRISTLVGSRCYKSQRAPSRFSTVCSD